MKILGVYEDKLADWAHNYCFVLVFLYFVVSLLWLLFVLLLNIFNIFILIL